MGGKHPKQNLSELTIGKTYVCPTCDKEFPPETLTKVVKKI